MVRGLVWYVCGWLVDGTLNAIVYYLPSGGGIAYFGNVGGVY
jgi:hypothetical protein